MKLLFLGLLLIPFLVGTSYGETYHHPNFDFSLEYPEGWDFDDELFIAEGIAFIVTFYDDIDEYYSYFDVQLIEADIAGRVGTDKQQLERLTFLYEGMCDSYSFEIEGFVCEDLNIEYTRVVNLNGYKAYEIKQSWNEIYPDDTYYDHVDIIRMIPGNSGAWYLYSETAPERLSEYEEKIFEMLDSFKLPESEINIKSDVMLTESGEYINDRYGFSITPPEGWMIGNENQVLNRLAFPITFHNPNYHGILTPSMAMMFMEMDSIDFSGYSEQESLDAFKEGFMQSVQTEGMEAEIIFENYEQFDTYAKISIRVEGSIPNPAGAPIFGKYEVISWALEDGKFYIIFYLADLDDFEDSFPAFRKSLNTLEIFEHQVDTSIEISPKIPDWVKNNAKWWSEELITDSDFIVGIEYLINTGSIQVQTTTYSETGKGEIPSWIKTNAGWWANEQISDDDFLKGIQFLIEEGLIQIEKPDVVGKDKL